MPDQKNGQQNVGKVIEIKGVVIGRVRRQVRLRLAPAAAAMAIAAVGLGSVVASTQLNRAPGIQPEVAPLPAPADFALNQGRSEQLKQLELARLAERPGPAVLP